MPANLEIKIQTASIDELDLDPRNPRLGADKIKQGLSQEQLLREMRDWELDELAVSFLESGFWPQEALIVIEEKVGSKKSKIVIEGNRRLASLKWLKESLEGNPPTAKWASLTQGVKLTSKLKKLFDEVPYILVEDRDSVTGFLGFRHVSGIKEWEPCEKAAFIAHMVDDLGLTYEQVMRRIGSKTEPVRRNYVAYKVFLQMQEQEDIDSEKVREKFSVLFLSLRGSGVQEYLGIDIEGAPAKNRKPVAAKKIPQLINYSTWLFGSELGGVFVKPIVTESRLVNRFDKCLGNKAAREYLERTDVPDLNDAHRIAGGEEFETFEDLENALTHIKRALANISSHRKSSRIKEVVVRVARASLDLLRGYPEERATVLNEEDVMSRSARVRN